MFSTRFVSPCALALSLLTLAACGGGGGGGTSPPPGSQLPVVNAGADKNAASASAVSLPGSATDSGGTITSYVWSQTSGAAVTLSNAATPTAGFTAPTVASNTPLGFRLTVTDNHGATGTDDIVVTITPPGAAGTVSLVGTITYDHVPHFTDGSLSYNTGIPQSPVRGATVQAVSGTTVLDTAVTSATGDYSLTVNASTSVFVRVRAEMVKTGAPPTWNFRVVDNTSAATPVYFFDGATASAGTAATQTRDINLPSGFDTGGVVTGARSAAPFAILDAVYADYTTVLVADAALAFPALTLGWSPNNVNDTTGGTATFTPCADNGHIGDTHYVLQYICVLGQVNVDTDEYDEHVISREFARYFLAQFSRIDYNIDGYPGGTSDGARLDPRVAFGEGFVNAFAGMAEEGVFYNASGPNQGGGYAFDLDDNAMTNPGWFSEGSVQSILYDLYDDVVDGADGINLGFAPIYGVLTGNYKTGVPQTTIFSFITELKAANPASAAAINTLVSAQGIDSATIDAYGSTETHNAGNAFPQDVLPVYTTLALGGGAAAVCTTDAYGFFNTLSNRRFMKFNLAAGTNVTFTAAINPALPGPVQTGADVRSDPDFRLYGAGGSHEGSATSGDEGSETFTQFLLAGNYVLELSEFKYESDTRPFGSETVTRRACFDVTAVTAP